MNRLVIFSNIVLLLSAMGAAAEWDDVKPPPAPAPGVADSATSHGDEVSSAVTEVHDGHAKKVMPYSATGHGEEVREAAQLLAKEKPQRGEVVAVIGKGQHDEFDSEEKLEERKGRNPQTGKEIKIPAKKIGTDTNDKSASATMRESDIYATLYLKTGGDSKVTIVMQEGRKGMNAVDVRRTD